MVKVAIAVSETKSRFAMFRGGMKAHWRGWAGTSALFLAASFAIYYCCVGFVYTESLQFTYALPCGQVKAAGCVDVGLLKQERVNLRQATIRALSDCFDDWRFESHTRSRPFYKRVVERVVERHGVVDAGAPVEEVSQILKTAQFEVVKGPDDALPVIALIVLKSRDSQLLKETAAIYRECVMEYAEDENKKREERAVSPLRGKYIALQAEVNDLNRSADDRNLSETQKASLLKRKAELKETLARLEGEVAEAEKIVRKYERVISFLPDTMGSWTSGNQ